MGHPSTIAVFRALQLGDMLCAVPALRALRGLYPQAVITLIGLPWAAQFRQRFARYLDRFIAFPGYPGLPEQAPDIRATLGLFQWARGRFDLALQMHGSGALTNSLLLLLGARRSAGFHPARGWCPGPEGWWPYPEDAHEVHRNLRLVRYLGASDIGAVNDRLEFPLTEADRHEAAEHARSVGLVLAPDAAYVCLHAGARHAAKRWAPERFAQVGAALAARGYQVVLTGSAAERPLAAAVAAAMRAPAINLACDISIGGMAALMAGARVVVSNDTGAAHLAVALDVPTVVIFFATDAARWAPLDLRRHRVLANASGVEVPDVLAALDELLVLEQR